MTFTLSAVVIGLVTTYFYQMSIAKKKAVVIINSDSVYFPRANKKLIFAAEYKFTSSEINTETPPTTGDDLDFIVDKKETHLYAWKGTKRTGKIRATLMNLNNNAIAAFLNELCQSTEVNRKDLIKKFYDAFMEHVDDNAKSRIVGK